MKKIVVEKDLGEKETFAKWNGKFLDETSYDKVIKVTDEDKATPNDKDITAGFRKFA